MIAGWWRRIVEIVRPAQLDREAAEEMAHHVDLLVARKVARGMSEAEARREVTIEVGSLNAARETIAEGRTGFLLEQCGRDVIYAARVLRRSPVMSLVSIVTMGAGIGVGALLFALVDAIVLQPLPYPRPDRLVRIFDTNEQQGVYRSGAASGNIADWRRRARTLAGVAAYYTMGCTLSTDADAEVVIAGQVSEDFFPLMGVPPLLGRTFTPEESRRGQYSSALAPIGANPTAVLSHRLWRQRFGGDPNVVGTSVMIERRAFTIVGVMPERFAAPDASVQLWIPWDLTRDDLPRDQHFADVIARMKDGITIAQAAEDLNAVAAALSEEHPPTNRGWAVQLSPLRTEMVGGAERMLWILLGAVALLLVVACANVALLTLMRGFDRSDETAVRLALGASSQRLIFSFLMESALLAVLGGLLGAAIAAGGLRMLPALTSDLPRIDEVSLDVRALAWIAALTIVSALVSGLPQAWRRLRLAPAIGLAAGSSRTTNDGRRHMLRDAIAIGQVAMAVMLLSGAGLLVRSFIRLRGVDPGFDPRGVLVAPVFLDSQAYNNAARSRAYYRALFERLGAIPGVVAVGGATTVPTSPLGPDFERPVWPEGAANDSARRIPASVRMVTPGYFAALKLRVVEGRAIDDRDHPTAPGVVMVSETLARRLWPKGHATGQRLMVDYSTAGTYPYEIVGVVGDMRFHGPRGEPGPEIYFPHAQRSYLVLNVVVKATGDPRVLFPAVREALKAVDPQKPAQGMYLLEDLIGATYARDRQAMTMLLVFAGTAVFLAVLAVYGVLAQRVRERSREIGIRMAMGATASSLVGWIAGAGLKLIATGLVAGLIGASLLTGMLEGLLFGVAPSDPLTAVAVTIVLGVVGLAAALVPSWRATRIDPVVILRQG